MNHIVQYKTIMCVNKSYTVQDSILVGVNFREIAQKHLGRLNITWIHTYKHARILLVD